MIKVNVKYNQNLISEIKITGHAMYAESGKDIVCSAVSTMTTTTINNILTLDEKAIEYNSDNGYILITNHDSQLADKLLNNMLDMLKELANDYPKNIQIGG